MISSINMMVFKTSKTIVAQCLCKCHHIKVNSRNLSTSTILWKKEDEFLDDADWWQNVRVSTTKVAPKVKEDSQSSPTFTEEFEELDKRLTHQTSVTKQLREAYLEPNERRPGGSQQNYRLPGLGKRKHEFDNKLQMPSLTKGEILHGVHPVSIALQEQKRDVYRLYTKQEPITPGVREIIDVCNSRGINHEVKPLNILDRLSSNRPHQGVCLDVSRLPVTTWREEDTGPVANESRNPVWLLPYKVQDPMNFGAVLRSAYYMGVEQVLWSKEDCSPLSPVVSKASSGAMELTNFIGIQSSQLLVRFLQRKKDEMWKIVGTSGSDSRKSCPLQTYEIADPTILVVGNEGSGLDEDILELCDVLLMVTPPSGVELHPGVDSLNVSVATGIILHHLAHSRAVLSGQRVPELTSVDL